MKTVLLLGAAGRDFHNFNVAGRQYPPSLSGRLAITSTTVWSLSRPRRFPTFLLRDELLHVLLFEDGNAFGIDTADTG